CRSDSRSHSPSRLSLSVPHLHLHSFPTRRSSDLTQQQLADKVGIKFQQIQKYETGMNRVSASRLWDVADALGVSISYFWICWNLDRKSTRLNSSHVKISYAVFCLKKKTTTKRPFT